MSKVINAVVINDLGQLLVVRKKDIWILPGGKPKENESDFSCLEREVKEELSGTRIKVGDFYNSFLGISPFTNSSIDVKVYFSSILGGINPPSGEIQESRWMNYDKRRNFSLSKTTEDIINELWNDGIYTGR